MPLTPTQNPGPTHSLHFFPITVISLNTLGNMHIPKSLAHLAQQRQWVIQTRWSSETFTVAPIHQKTVTLWLLVSYLPATLGNSRAQGTFSGGDDISLKSSYKEKMLWIPDILSFSESSFGHINSCSLNLPLFYITNQTAPQAVHILWPFKQHVQTILFWFRVNLGENL